MQILILFASYELYLVFSLQDCLCISANMSLQVFSSLLGGGGDWNHLVRWPLIGLLYQPRMIDNECGAIRRMRTNRGNRSTQRKPAPVPLCPPQIPHDMTWARTRAVAVGRRRLTAWVMARPSHHAFYYNAIHSSSLLVVRGPLNPDID
jgi:hypothetical protein